MQLVLSFDVQGGSGITYYITDLCVTLLAWSATAIPASSDAFIAGRLLRFLFVNARHSSGPVLRNNIGMIKLFIEKWKCVTIVT